jgi:hypothetical protein
VAVLNQVRKRLKVHEIRKCRDFAQLHALVEAAISQVQGVGALFIYDTALRIGAKLGVKPKRVHLHRGTRMGAKSLGLNHNQPALQQSELPAALRILAPHEVEDLLCIYKNELSRFAG